MAGFVKWEIGSRRVYTFNPETVTEQTYRGQPAEYAIKVCFAQSKNVIWEIMQPLSRSTIFQEFLDRHGQGIHHIAFNRGDRPWDERIQEFECPEPEDWFPAPPLYRRTQKWLPY
ncbi:VOC family protein [Pleurocapsales cyanobacterium LEGE 06147]|nr:VOC family protein [Pleurocapsales cyanobacterium LEGE 06147]